MEFLSFLCINNRRPSQAVPSTPLLTNSGLAVHQQWAVSSSCQSSEERWEFTSHWRDDKCKRKSGFFRSEPFYCRGTLSLEEHHEGFWLVASSHPSSSQEASLARVDFLMFQDSLVLHWLPRAMREGPKIWLFSAVAAPLGWGSPGNL